jgi:formamidopyrimidine-DNA glycosylase
MRANLRRLPGSMLLGEALQVQRAVAGIGNMWMCEALWQARVSPWRSLDDVSDEEVGSALRAAASLMRASAAGGVVAKQVHRRAGHACRRCGEAIRSWPLGSSARTAYWCPRCQDGGEEPPAK